MQTSLQKRYLPLVGLALLALVLALWAGLLRLGWNLPAIDGLGMAHGPLMVSGFLGTLVTLERAVAIRKRWMFLAPVFTGLGWVSLMALPDQAWGAVLLTLGSLGGVAILAYIVRREAQLHTWMMFSGSLVWFASNILWLAGRPFFQIVPWWQAFLILTIAGERLELNRVMRPSRRSLVWFTLAAGLFLLGVLLDAFQLVWAARLAGAGMLGMAVWLVRGDIATRNLRHRLALTRYIAWSLFLGFLWLGVGGVLNLVLGMTFAGPLYDAALHTVFVGFVISMIFGHAPIIFSALLQVQVTFKPIFYIHLVLLHGSLVLRILGDLAQSVPLRQWGGLLNEVAIVIFLGVMVWALAKGRRFGSAPAKK